ncbi:MAG TPA: ankyrin repeat domain-containing protein [Candidatus Dependentiae bacterium]|nr:ankyrin repeat domain-containing protein [Candidatus Dependentiae bacterium]
MANISLYGMDIFQAVCSGNVARARELIGAGVNVDLKDSNGETLLYLAVSNDRQDVVAMLIAHGANVNIPNNNDDNTPLHCAVARNAHVVDAHNLEIIRMLIDAGANVNQRAGICGSPFHWAVLEGNKEIVSMLLAAHADINLKDHNGLTPLCIATDKGYQEIVELIHRFNAARSQAITQMEVLLGAAISSRLGIGSPAQLLFDMQTNGLAHRVGEWVLEAAKEAALEK